MRFYDARTYTDLGALVVDGETFSLRNSDDGATHYDWVSGRNVGYGFSTSGEAETLDHAKHTAAIRDFLAGIDPTTGYL